MKHFAITAKTANANNFVGWFPAGPLALVTTDTREAIETKLAQALALALEHQTPSGPQPRSLADVDPETLEGCEDVQTLWVEPAPMNAVSLEIARAIKASGLSQAEVARRLGVSRSAINRMVDPFYHGHSMPTLERLAMALGMRLEPPQFQPARAA